MVIRSANDRERRDAEQHLHKHRYALQQARADRLPAIRQQAQDHVEEGQAKRRQGQKQHLVSRAQLGRLAGGVEAHA